MCHLILALPIASLPILWLVPLRIAIPLYAFIMVLSGVVYGLALRAMKMPVCNGRETLLDAVGTVRRVEGHKALVWTHSELWSAETDGETLREGDKVKVTAVDGLNLKVQKISLDESLCTSNGGAH